MILWAFSAILILFAATVAGNSVGAADREASCPSKTLRDASMAVYEGRILRIQVSLDAYKGLTASPDPRRSRGAGEPGSRNPGRMSPQPRGFPGAGVASDYRGGAVRA